MPRHATRSQGSRLEDGSYRPSRHGPLDGSAPAGAGPPPAAKLRPPRDIPPALRPFWRQVVAELLERGTLHAPDLETLADGFRQLAIARALQARLTTALADPKATVAELARLQTALASASSAAGRVFLAFGVASPLARARVKGAPAKKPKPKPINEILSRANKTRAS